MKLLILDGARDPRSLDRDRYRGTYRAHPTYCDALPESHELNQLFFWFLEEGGELGVVRDLRKARRLAELWNAQTTTNTRFEVVEVTDGAVQPEGEGVFLGYDLSAGYNLSLLAFGLMSAEDGQPIPERAGDLWRALKTKCTPELNAHGLFQTYASALGCLTLMLALQRRSPDFFEGGDLTNFAVTGLYSLSAPVDVSEVAGTR